MTETPNTAVTTETRQQDFRITMLFHPSHHVPNLSQTESFFERVFGRSSKRLSAMTKSTTARDYSTFTPIADVLFDSLDPTLTIVDEAQIFKTAVEPHLNNIGWYVEGAAAAFQTLSRHGIRLTNQAGEVADGDDPPLVGGKIPMFFTLPDDTGQRYQLTTTAAMPVDSRLAPGWVLPPVSDDDPLGIERCARHTFVTRNPDRALRFIVDALGGTVVHEGRNEALGASSTYVHLADSIFEYAVPDDGTSAHGDWVTRAPHDTYHSITWKVVDLDRVAHHLAAEGVRIRTRTENSIITDAATSLGVPWGFTTDYTSGDPRVA